MSAPVSSPTPPGFSDSTPKAASRPRPAATQIIWAPRCWRRTARTTSSITRRRRDRKSASAPRIESRTRRTLGRALVGRPAAVETHFRHDQNRRRYQRRDLAISLVAPVAHAEPDADFVGAERDHGFIRQLHPASAPDARAVDVARAQPGAAAKVSGARADRDLAMAGGDRRMGQHEIAVERAADADRRGVEALDERAPAFGVDDPDARVDAAHDAAPARDRCVVSRFETM